MVCSQGSTDRQCPGFLTFSVRDLAVLVRRSLMYRVLLSSPVYDYVNGRIVSNDVVMTKANIPESFQFNL